VLSSGAHCLQQEFTVSLTNSEESSKNLLQVLSILILYSKFWNTFKPNTNKNTWNYKSSWISMILS